MLSAYNQRKDSRRIQRHCLHSHLQHSLWKGTLQNCQLRGVKYGTLCLHAVSMTATQHAAEHRILLTLLGSSAPDRAHQPAASFPNTRSAGQGALYQEQAVIGCFLQLSVSDLLMQWSSCIFTAFQHWEEDRWNAIQTKSYPSPTKRAGWCWQRSCQTGGHNRQR